MSGDILIKRPPQTENMEAFEQARKEWEKTPKCLPK